MNFVDNLLFHCLRRDHSTGFREFGQDHIPVFRDFRDREAQVGQIGYILIPWISKVASSDLRSTFEQVTSQRPFAQEVVILRVPAKLKE